MRGSGWADDFRDRTLDRDFGAAEFRGDRVLGRLAGGVARTEGKAIDCGPAGGLTDFRDRTGPGVAAGLCGSRIVG